jgi:predicted DNA-binding ribbon-helix-helix protein
MPLVNELGARHDGRTSRGPSTLVQRNIAIGAHRTTVRLEPAMWDALDEICEREGLSLNELCGRIAGRRSASSVTAAVRVFVMSYFRAAATEDGHARTGHGLLYKKPRQ